MTSKQAQIVVDISPAGNVVFDAQGFKGCGCEEATQQMVLLLGGGETHHKPDYYQAPLSTAQPIKRTF